MKNWVDKRFEMDHLKKLLSNGVPLSVHSANGWYGQLERVERFKNRAIEAISEEDSLDFSFAFFQACYHLREWIPTFEMIDNKIWDSKWNKFVKENDCIKYCRDICNITKHLTITKASVTANVVITRNFIDDGSDYGKFIGWTLHLDNKEIDLYELMEECLTAWKKFIKEDIFDYLEISKYLDNK